jgi:hypothetical protein
MKTSWLLILLLFSTLVAAQHYGSTLAIAQTTYTTTVDGCGAKNLGVCSVDVQDGAGNHYRAVLDHRFLSAGYYINRLELYTYDNPPQTFASYHGAFTGFVADPSWDKATHHSGSGAFTADDGSGVTGQFDFDAYYIRTCAGRGCAGVSVGWHYRVLLGSTITVP